jgi:hypothetical protein
MIKKNHSLWLILALVVFISQACSFTNILMSKSSKATSPTAETPASSLPESVNQTGLPAGMPEVETDFGKMVGKLQSGNYAYFENFASENYDASVTIRPGTRVYTVSFSPNETIFLQYSWCAREEGTLQANMQHITTSFYFNDQSIPAEYVTTLSTQSEDWECANAGMLLSGWQPGVYRFRVVANFNEKINDGESDYEAGDYISEYNVTVQ